MRKNYEQGLTLVEVLASITILSIVIVGLLSIFPKAYSFVKANQSKTLAVNIGRGALHYFEKQDYDLLNGYRAALTDGTVASFDSAAICTETKSVEISGETIASKLFPNSDSCEKILEPTINNITYNHQNIQVFLMPSAWGTSQEQEVLTHMKEVYPDTKLMETEEALKKMREQSEATEEDSQIVNVLVYVDLNEKDSKEGVLLEGSMTHESLR